MRHPWKAEELSSLLKTLKKCRTIQEATQEHNKVWQTGRTHDSIQTKLRHAGLGGCAMYLKLDSVNQQIHEDDYIPKLVAFVKNSVRSISEVCDYLDLSPKRIEALIGIAQKRGFKLKPLGPDRIHLDMGTPTRQQITPLTIKAIKGYYTVASISDTHFASKLQMQGPLENFVSRAYKEFGVRDVFYSGDVLAGINMYPGQNAELQYWSMDDQVKCAVDGLPQHTGLRYHTISGNHDHSFMKSAGTDPIAKLSDKRPDVINYGFYNALININGIKWEIHHPDKAGAYAISYHMQKEIEQMPGGTKPQIALFGHTHQKLWLPSYRNVSGFLCGCFEGQTLYLKRKHLDPSIGGWILKVGITDDGDLGEITATFLKYYHDARPAPDSPSKHDK